MIYAVASKLYVDEIWIGQQQNLYMKRLLGLLPGITGCLVIPALIASTT